MDLTGESFLLTSDGAGLKVQEPSYETPIYDPSAAAAMISRTKVSSKVTKVPVSASVPGVQTVQTSAIV
ncbi:hypothetical protein TIFTF001_023211 [Ficus carica]|uniref:Uncharacterized protein n=1 Tax=Ficus carica TaxID=3494 RepID=A0AA88AE76_FICCA|nr:hypothetical protein TIFTF001_023211 [Ficus carica]